MALSYYFGSSASSKQKTYAMSNNMADFPEREQDAHDRRGGKAALQEFSEHT
jgi:hypothetical protein